jgi:hypothetical protein
MQYVIDGVVRFFSLAGGVKFEGIAGGPMYLELNRPGNCCILLNKILIMTKAGSLNIVEHR